MAKKESAGAESPSEGEIRSSLPPWFGMPTTILEAVNEGAGYPAIVSAIPATMPRTAGSLKPPLASR